METVQPAKKVKTGDRTLATAPIRVRRETKRRIAQELAKVNKKDFGKKVRPDDLISLALGLVQEQHLKQLQDKSLSNADRMELQYHDYVRQHGSISKDQFLGKLLGGDLIDSRPATASETDPVRAS